MELIFFAFFFGHPAWSTVSLTDSISVQQLQSSYEQEDWLECTQRAHQALRDASAAALRTEEVAQVYLWFGDCLLEMQKFDSAFWAYQAAMQNSRLTSDPLLLGESFIKMGHFHLLNGEYQAAISLLDSALQLLTDPGLRKRKADVLNNLGICYWGLGDSDRARTFHEQALSIRTQISEDPKLIAQSHNNLGECLQDLGDTTRAKLHFETALASYEQKRAYRSTAEVLMNLGSLYSRMDKWEEAQEYYQRAIDQYRQDQQVDSLGLAKCIMSLGNCATKFGRYDLASEYHDLALSLQESKWGKIHTDIALTKYNQAITALYMQRPDRSLALLEEASIALRFDKNDETTLWRVTDPWLLLNMLDKWVEAYIQKYFLTNQTEHLKQAFSMFDWLDRALDQQRTTYRGEASLSDLITTSHTIYGKAIELAYMLYEETGEQKYWHLAFTYCEKSKGLLLLEALQSAKAGKFANVPPYILDSLSQTKDQISRLKKRKFLVGASHSTDAVKLDSEIFGLKEQLDDQINTLAQSYPDYFNLRYETVPPTINHVQQSLLSENQTVISYFIDGDKLWIFTINRDNFKMSGIRIPEVFSNGLNNFMNAIRSFPVVPHQFMQNNLAVYQATAKFLRKLLIGPVEDQLQKRLVIVPDGRLNYLPFEALLDDSADTTQMFAEYPFLVKKYAINYNYSVRLWHEMQDNPQAIGLKNYLGFAPVFSGDTSLQPLQYNREEVEEVSASLGGRVFLGREASKVKFLNHSDDYQIIHLATHGLSRRGSAKDFSFLAFGTSDNQKGLTDHYLFVNEIYNLSIPAEMVVLSACETGTGQLFTGEGIASIARSFAYAGARSLVATRWNVNDRTTRDIIVNFFEKIKDGLPKDVALNQSINAFIQSNSRHHAHPFYWASFLAIGNMQPVSMVKTTRPIFWSVIILVCVLAIVGFFRFKKIQKPALNPTANSE